MLSSLFSVAAILFGAAIAPIALIGEGGDEAIAGMTLLIVDCFVAYYAGKFALFIQRDFCIPEFLCGPGILGTALLGWAGFNWLITLILVKFA